MKRKEKEKQIILSQSFLSTIECFPKMFTSSCFVTSSALSVFLSGTKILLFSPCINNHNLPAIIDGYVTFIITNKYTIQEIANDIGRCARNSSPIGRMA